MYIPDDSEKNAEVADLQENEFDSQFEDSEIEDSDDYEDEGSEIEEGENESEDAEPAQKEPEPKNKQTEDDNAKFAAARREAEKQARELKDRQDNFARQYGYNSFEELENAQKQQTYEQQGYDSEMAKKLVQMDSMMKDMEVQKNRARIAEEKSKLSTKPFFKELEPEIDEILNENPTLPLELVFDVVKGKNIEKLLTQKNKAASQRTLNSINSKGHIRPDAKGTEIDTIQIDQKEFDMYKKLNPKATKAEWAKFIKSEKRR